MLATRARKGLALLLSLTMCVSLLGTAAYAVEEGLGGDDNTQTQTQNGETLTPTGPQDPANGPDGDQGPANGPSGDQGPTNEPDADPAPGTGVEPTPCEHVWDAGVVTTEPTCVTPGTTTYTCSLCNETKTETIEALGHDFDKGVCSRCGEEDPDYETPAYPEEAYTWDAETGTLTYTGEAFDTNLNNLPEALDGTIKVLILDNPEMVISGNGVVNDQPRNKTVETIIVQRAKSIGDSAFATYSGAKEIEVAHVKTVGAYSFSNTPATKVTLHDIGTLGPQSFQMAMNLRELTMENIGTLETGVLNQFKGSRLELKGIGTIKENAVMIMSPPKSIDLYLEDIGVIEENAFMNSMALKTLHINGVDWIGSRAFYKCALSSVTIEECGTIEDMAFDGCTILTTFDVPDETRLGYSNSFAKIEPLKARMMAAESKTGVSPLVLPELKAEDEKLEVTDRTYTSIKEGAENTTAAGGSQLTKAAGWINGDKTEAQVQLQFRYAPEAAYDFLFVLDASTSMGELGSEDDTDSRYYNELSKLLNITDALLAEGTDNRVGIVTFSGYAEGSKYVTATEGTFSSYAFSQEPAVVRANLDATPAPDGNTDYITALDTVLALINGREDTSRQVAVIFITDGEPTVDADKGTYVAVGEPNPTGKAVVGSEAWEAMLPDIAARSAAIEETGARIYGIIQSITSDEEAYCQLAMESVCTEGLLYTTYNNAGFSQAVNDAIYAAVTGATGGDDKGYTLTDVVDPAFRLDEESIQVSVGTYTVGTNEDGNTVITWTIPTPPYTTQSMTYRLFLDPVGYGTFDTNEGTADVTKGEDPVNEVETPQLPREQPYVPVTPTDPTPDPDPQPSDPAEEIPDEDTPKDEQPDLPGQEETETPEETEINEEEPPLADAPETGDSLTAWITVAALSGLGLVALAVTGRKGKEEEL